MAYLARLLGVLAKARAATLHTILFGVLCVRDQLHERRHHFCVAREDAGVLLSELQEGPFTLAAAQLLFDVTGRLLALQLTLGARAGGGLGTRPRARRLLTQRSTVGLRSHTSGVALSRRADSLALGARGLLAHILRAANRALRLFTVDRALRALRLLTLHLALRACTDGVADGGARRVVALPATSRVSVLLRLSLGVNLGFGVDFRRNGGHDHNGQQQSNSTHLCFA